MALPYEFQIEEIIKEKRISKYDLDEIKIWIETTSLPALQDEMIALFLISCCSDIEATKTTILKYFKLKNHAPELFFGRDMENIELQKAMNVIICTSLPRRMPNNTVIHFFKLQDTNWRNYDLVSSMKLTFMLVDVSQRYNPPNELIVVADVKGSNLMHLACFKLSILKKFIDYVQEAMPLKIQLIHVLNANYVFDRCLALAKAFMKNEILSKIILHSPTTDMQDFYKNHIPESCLPKDYGGELPSSEELNQMTIRQFSELREFYCKEEQLVRKYQK